MKIINSSNNLLYNMKFLWSVGILVLLYIIKIINCKLLFMSWNLICKYIVFLLKEAIIISFLNADILLKFSFF